jgi:hypothetical protein
MRGGPVPTGTFDSSPVRSAGKWYRRHVRPGRDDRNARGPVSHPMSRARISHSIVHSGTHRFLENATQHFVLGYFPMSLRSPGNADLSDEAAGVSNDGAKSENADIAASAGNGKRRALSYLHRPAGRYLMYFSPITLVADSPRRPRAPRQILNKS